MPHRSRDGTELLTNPKGMVGRWKRHFHELFNRPTEVDLTFLHNITDRLIKHLMIEVLNLAQIKAAIRKMNN